MIIVREFVCLDSIHESVHKSDNLMQDTTLCDLPKWSANQNNDETMTVDTLVIQHDDASCLLDCADSSGYQELIFMNRDGTEDKHACDRYDAVFDVQKFLDECHEGTQYLEKKELHFYEGLCIMFVLKKIIFKRRPENSFDNDIISSLATSTLFQGAICSDETRSNMNFDFFKNTLLKRNIAIHEIIQNLGDVYDELRMRTTADIYLVNCSLNQNYNHKSNKFGIKNPFVENHCVLFRRGNIICAYLGDARLSLTKHLKITDNCFGVDNTSGCSYISNIKSIFKIVYSS